MNNRTTGILIAAMLLAVVTALPAQAADKDWEFEITPYLWTAGIDADVEVGNQAASINASFSDILDKLDIGALVLMRAERNHWVLWTQLDYLALSTENPPANGSFDSDVTLITAGFGREFESSNGRRALDVMLGARYLSMDNKLELDGIGTFSRKRSLTDPVIILRPSFQISERWRFNPTFSFGSGGDSEKTYELQPQVQFQMTERMALRFGYRKLYYDIESDTGNSFDGSFQGLIIGVGGTFGGN